MSTGGIISSADKSAFFKDQGEKDVHPKFPLHQRPIFEDKDVDSVCGSWILNANFIPSLTWQLLSEKKALSVQIFQNFYEWYTD